MSDGATLELLIQIRDELAGLNRTRQGLREGKKEAESFGAVLRQGLGIGSGMEMARQGIELLKNTIRSTVGEAIRFAGQTRDTAEALGLTTGVLQVLQLEFKAAGADASRLTMAVQSQHQSLAEARDATSAAAQAYRDLGLDAAVVERMPIAERMIAVARATNNATDQAKALTAAAQILGGRGLGFVLSALRNLGDEGVAALQRLYEKQGLIAGEETLRRLDLAEKQWAKLWHSIVIGTADALAGLEAFGKSTNKWGSFGSLMLTGPLGLNFGQFAAKVAMSQPATPVKPSGQTSKDIADAQARDAASKAAAEAAKELAKAQATAAAELKRAGEETTQSVLLPYERYTQTLKELKTQLDGGAISNITYARATDQAREELQKAWKVVDPFADAIRSQGEAIRSSVLTPMEQWAEETRAIANAYKAGTISLEIFSRAMDQADADLRKRQEPKKPEWKRPEGAIEGYAQFLSGIGTQGQQTAELLQQSLGQTMSTIANGIWEASKGTQAWGESFRQLGDIAGRMLTQMITQMLVIQSINAVLGIFGFGVTQTAAGAAITKLPVVKAAGGGTFMTRGPTQFTVGDNPGGVEMVSVLPISGVGRTTVSGQALAMAGGGSALVAGAAAGGSGGDTIFIDASNADAAGLARLEAMFRAMNASVEHRSLSAGFEAKRRRRFGYR